VQIPPALIERRRTADNSPDAALFACLALGRLYFDMDLGFYDLDRAIGYYTSACELDDVVACFTMADKLEIGSPTTPGYESRQERAAQLHEHGCGLGGVDSCLAPAGMFSEGRGTAKDLARVPALLERSCALGSADGCYRVATELPRGAGRNTDDVRRLLLKACAGGNSSACTSLD
jgi:TPR repeat protein